MVLLDLAKATHMSKTSMGPSEVKVGIGGETVAGHGCFHSIEHVET